MNKQELIDKIAEDSMLTKADAGRALNSVLNAVQETLAKGESVTLVGFGTFSVKDRPARTGRNPQSGKPMEIAASKVPNFKAGQTLKDAVK